MDLRGLGEVGLTLASTADRGEIAVPSIDAVAWAVPPGKGLNTRPARLLVELEKLGIVSPDAPRYFHGRAAAEGSSVSAGSLDPIRGVPASAERLALMSPVFRAGVHAGAAWYDFYDDWSLAPDINALHRVHASRTYAAMRRGVSDGVLVTCNTPYMAGRVGLDASHVLPNGVDSEIADYPPSGDARSRLLLLGKFFDGRTDWELIQQVTAAVDFDEIVVGHPGDSKPMGHLLDQLHRMVGERLVVKDWLDSRDLAALAGPRTVALVPHVVTDYTLSQDLMKVYQLQGHGIRMICPRLLWPTHLSVEHAYLVDFGADYTRLLAEWIESPTITEEWRQNFISQHSWTARAKSLAARMQAIR